MPSKHSIRVRLPAIAHYFFIFFHEINNFLSLLLDGVWTPKKNSKYQEHWTKREHSHYIVCNFIIIIYENVFLWSDRGVTVSMDAFQAFDPGSTPAIAHYFFIFFHEINNFLSLLLDGVWTPKKNSKYQEHWTKREHSHYIVCNFIIIIYENVFLWSDRGVTVSMDAFQAFDPGSTPGDRTLFFYFFSWN